MRLWTRENSDLLSRFSSRAEFRAKLQRTLTVGRLLRKFDPDQPRVPAGSSNGGQWTNDAGVSGQSAGVSEILEMAAQLAAGRAKMSECVDLCLPLLNRFQLPGSDRNEFDFRKCLNACLGINQ